MVILDINLYTWVDSFTEQIILFQLFVHFKWKYYLTLDVKIIALNTTWITCFAFQKSWYFLAKLVQNHKDPQQHDTRHFLFTAVSSLLTVWNLPWPSILPTLNRWNSVTAS